MYRFLVALFCTVCFGLSSQTKLEGTAPLSKEINIADTNLKDYAPILSSPDQRPIPAAEFGHKKEELYKKRLEAQQAKKKSGSGDEAVSPKIIQQFEGNLATSVPSDNDIAVGLDGTVVSAVNSTIQVYTEAGVSKGTKTLAALASSLGSFTHNSDPRLLYDAQSDRYIIVWFTGNLSTNNKIIVGFTKTNDPWGAWNFYTLNGNSFNDSTWSDYPIISVSNKDLFITFNQVKDNVSWTIGFKQSVIWQIDKQKGYDGEALKYTLWSDIKHQGGNLRNICPAKYQTASPDSNMYFLSVRNVASANDSIFLLEINNTYESGKAQLKQRVLKSPVKYGFPPNAFQKAVSGKIQQLMTNDARVLAAIYENGYVHFGLNSILPNDVTATVMLGTIKNVNSSQPKVETKLLDFPRMEFGYPSMTYVGESEWDHKVLFAFSHCRIDSFAGTSVIYKDAKDNFSKLLIVKEGDNVINQLSDSIERWGDYTNIQNLHQNPKQAFLTGSFGKSNSRMGTWLAKLEVNDTVKGTKPVSAIISNEPIQKSIVYPNPVVDNFFQVEFELTDKEFLRFYLTDMQGREVIRLLETNGHIGKNEFKFRTNDLAAGSYILHISGSKKFQISKPLIVE